MSYQLIEKLTKKAVTVSQACHTLEVSRAPAITQQSSDAAQRTRGVCGWRSFESGFRRQWAYLRQSQVARCAAHEWRDDGAHKVRCLMRLNGLHPVWKRKFVHTDKQTHDDRVTQCAGSPV